MKSIILLIVLSIVSLSAYSQVTLSTAEIKEVNTRLAEGLECKQLLPVMEEQVNVLDSLNLVRIQQIDNLQQQLELVSQREQLQADRFERAMKELADYRASSEKSLRKMRRWRTVGITGGVGVVGLGAILLMSIK